jgi:hypothetical protein
VAAAVAAAERAGVPRSARRCRSLEMRAGYAAARQHQKKAWLLARRPRPRRVRAPRCCSSPPPDEPRGPGRAAAGLRPQTEALRHARPQRRQRFRATRRKCISSTGAIHVFMLTFAKPSSSRLGAILPLNQPNKVRNRGAAAAGAANKSTRSRAYRLAGRSLLGARLLPAMRLLALLLGVLGLFCPAQAQQCELTDGIVRFALCLLPLRPRSHTAVAHAIRDARERP